MRRCVPVYPGKRYQDCQLEDPDSKPLETVRSIRNDIALKVQDVLTTLRMTATEESGSSGRKTPLCNGRPIMDIEAEPESAPSSKMCNR